MLDPRDKGSPRFVRVGISHEMRFTNVVVGTYIWIEASHNYLAPWRDGGEWLPIRWVRIRKDVHDRRV
jgi:hypothetical protein